MYHSQSAYSFLSISIRHYSICACLTLLCSVDGLSVTTVEGIGSVRSLHPVQERIAKSHGSQCGFCTPGMVMSMYTLLRNNPQPSQAEVERAFDGNLCRCTGYRPILDGYKTFTKVGSHTCSDCMCMYVDGIGFVYARQYSYMHAPYLSDTGLYENLIYPIIFCESPLLCCVHSKL